MRKIKRVSVEVRHREVTVTMEGSPFQVNEHLPAPKSVAMVCPACGYPERMIVARTEAGVSSGVERIQRALEQGDLPRQDAAVAKPPG
jgi:hypothetical protein